MSAKLAHPLVLALTLLGLAGASFGTVCALDPRPGATLLLPYFEVAADGPPGPGTFFTVINTSRQGVIAQVVLWSELGYPIFAFPLYLGGYDEQTVDLSEVVLKTVYPATNLNPLARQRFPTCPETLAGTTGPHVPALIGRTDMIQYLNGSYALYARPPAETGTHLARGFVTVDVVRDCTQSIPGSAGYFVNGGTGIATNDNVLIGHFLYTDLRPGRGFVQSGQMVSLEADAADPRLSGRTKYTFYARHLGFSGDDNREPLGTVQAVQYLAGGGLEAELVYWRDSRDTQTDPGYAYPYWFPLIETQVTIFDEDRRGTSLPLPTDPPVFPAMAGKVALVPPPHPLPGQPVPFPTTALNRLLVDHPFGWMHLNLNLPRVGADSIPAQSWAGVLVRRPVDPRVGVLLKGTSMDSACAPNLAPLVLPGLPQHRRPGGE